MIEENIKICGIELLMIVFCAFCIGIVFGGCIGSNSTKKDFYIEGQQSCAVCEVKK